MGANIMALVLETEIMNYRSCILWYSSYFHGVQIDSNTDLYINEILKEDDVLLKF